MGVELAGMMAVQLPGAVAVTLSSKVHCVGMPGAPAAMVPPTSSTVDPPAASGWLTVKSQVLAVTVSGAATMICDGSTTVTTALVRAAPVSSLVTVMA